MENLTALRSLVTALDAGSLSGAARKLGLSQSAVSQQIAALEHGYDQVLVFRGRSGVRPTEAGQIVAGHAASALAALDLMRDDLASLRGEVKGRLRVASSLILTEMILVDVAARLRKLHPDLTLEFVTGDQVV
ncbi:MAG: LysR family transcriptional regulator, partial [Deltaproteobacteria bacterium]